MILMWFKGIDKRRCGLPGTCMPTGHAVAVCMGQQHAQKGNITEINEIMVYGA